MPAVPISLPSGFIPVVSENEDVRQGQVIAKKSTEEDATPMGDSSAETISLVELLHVSIKKAPKYLKKEPGDLIREGEIVASRSKGIHTTDIVSNVTGTIAGYDRATGVLGIRKHTKIVTHVDDSNEIIAPLDGIVEVCNNEQIVLRTKQAFSEAAEGIGGQVHAILIEVPLADGKQSVDGVDLNVSMIEAILLGPSITKEAMVKAASMGIKGAVVGILPAEDKAYLLEKQIVFPILAVDEKTYQNLRKQVGKEVFLDPENKTVSVSA